jgi:ABC-type uncharacterized transport system substrate-binding protein
MAAGALAAPLAAADVTPLDLQVAARALSFMERPLSGRVRVGVVYSPQSPRSSNQAQQLRTQLGAGLRVGNIELVPGLVALGDAARADVDLFLLTEHVPPGEAALAGVSKARQIPCVTTDVEQVRSGACIMAVRSRPKVEIIVNRDAANDSGLRFATAFRVMVTEI